jgi:hypothetical protein
MVPWTDPLLPYRCAHSLTGNLAVGLVTVSIRLYTAPRSEIVLARSLRAFEHLLSASACEARSRQGELAGSPSREMED